MSQPFLSSHDPWIGITALVKTVTLLHGIQIQCIKIPSFTPCWEIYPRNITSLAIGGTTEASIAIRNEIR